MIRAILILTKSGSCKFYRIYDPDWKQESVKDGIISYISSITSIPIELGEKAPERIVFGEQEVLYKRKGKYILAIVKNIKYYSPLIKRVKDAFIQFFNPLTNNENLVSLIEDEIPIHERNQIKTFSRHLNLIVNSRTNTRTKEKTEKRQHVKISKQALVVKDVDLLVTTKTGQPIYLLFTLLLPYDGVLLVAFISAILDLGHQCNLGELKIIEGKNVILYLESSEKTFTIVVTQNKNQKESYKRFANFVAHFCNDWLKKIDETAEEAFEIYSKREYFEKIIKLMIDTETWERHMIKQKEIKALETLDISIEM